MLSRRLLFLQFIRHFSHQHSDSQTLKLLTHKDWLSPTQVLKTIKNIKNPDNLVPAFQHYKTRKDYKPSEPLFTLLLAKLSQAKLFDAIETIIPIIHSDRLALTEDFYYNLMRIYGLRANRISKVIDTLFGMQDSGGGFLIPSVKSLNFVLNLLVNRRCFEFVSEVYVRGCKMGVKVDSCCLNILVKGLCKARDFDGAVRLLEEFERQGCRPNARTFSTLMFGLFESGRERDAIEVFERMERDGVEADTVVYNVLISGLRKGGRVDEGVRVLEVMKRKGCFPNWGSYQEVLYGLIDEERFGEAKVFMGRMIEDGIGPSFVSYKLMVHGLCKEGMFDSLEWVIKEMVHQGFVPRMGMWKRVVQSLVKPGKKEAVCATFDDLVTNCCSSQNDRSPNFEFVTCDDQI